ncbi:MAG TPA: hydantoinase/oxoprolinase family protein [Candidatus Bathyarchaeia archaeon]|nr:hydantoinase/oxoprolinase family protein [Candidatus Bathyarchaeia archaeon]
MGRYRLGIDIGGTFTDFSLLDEATGELASFKSPTVPGDPGRGVLDGVRALVRERGFDPGAIDYLVHGTTIAINTVIQRNGASLGLLLTAGFGDLLEIQRLRLASPVNFTATRPLPLIPRYRVGEVTERILADGTVDTALDHAELLREAARLVEREGAEALVISFVNAYRTPAHELEARKVLAERFPGVHVTCSHEVWPQIREYERTMVAILSAYVRPRVDQYLGRLERELGGAGVRVPLYITKSNGGVTTARDARQATAETMLSGPASGVIGATSVCVRAGYRNLITFDMGGTSADIALVRNGRPVYSTDETVGDFPIVMPVVGVSSIGAGGGSIAWIDSVGVLKVGPQSAGADPGPACYGRGAKAPALSDAFLLCGFLNPDNFVGGRLRLHPDKAALAMQPLGEALGLDVDATAEAVIEVATSNMYVAFSNVLARHGLDPRDFALVAFGGAGPVEACFLAEEFHIPRVIVPPSPGTLCAQGAMTADLKSDYVKTIHRKLSTIPGTLLTAECAELSTRARRWLSEEAPGASASAIAHSADLRYVGQAFQIEVPIDPGWLDDAGPERLRTAFHELHERLYAHADRAADVELIDLRATITAATPKPEPRPVPSGHGAAKAHGRRFIHYRKQRYDAAVYLRRDLLAGQHVDGPAVVEQEDTTTLVPAGFRATVDGFGNLVIEVR